MNNKILIIQLVFTFVCLLYATYVDEKHRHVPNKLWAVMLVFVPIFYIMQDYTIEAMAISFIVMFFFAYVILWRLCGFGAADSKAFIVLSIYFPFFYLNTPVAYWMLAISLIYGAFYVAIRFMTVLLHNWVTKHPVNVKAIYKESLTPTPFFIFILFSFCMFIYFCLAVYIYP